MEKGFLQLAIELIALNKWLELEQPILYGAVSTGNIWRFGKFDRNALLIVQDLNLYRVPADVESLLRILIKILEP